MICIIVSFFNVLVNLSATTDFPSLRVGYIIISFFSSHDFNDLQFTFTFA